MSSEPTPDRELFGTLLASKPKRSRSWNSLGIAVILHVVLIALAIVTFKPFAPRPETEEFLPIPVIIVEEDAVHDIPNPFVRPAPPPAVAAGRAQPRREEELVYRPGPLAPIVIDPNARPVPAADEPEPVGVPGGAPGGSLSGRLLPRNVDPRISTPSAFPPAAATPAEALRARIADRLAAYNDSVAADEAARYTDWTVKGKDGKRWGVTTDTIYLGRIAIPTKRVAFQPPRGKRDEINARVRDFNEIERQAMLEESRSSFKERVESIRKRKDRERAEKQKKAEDKPITESR